nr:hypothetical protein B0A51_04106 [Rachicladosporium sp. CCFEE 5018]
MMRRSAGGVPTWLFLMGHAAGQVLPYNHTRILSAPDSWAAHIFGPSPKSIGHMRLQYLDPIKTINSSTSPFTTLYDDLTFLGDTEHTPYTAVIDAAGNITIISGNCTKGAEGIKIYQLAPQSDAEAGNVTWTQYGTSDESDGGTTLGANYLAGAISFSGASTGDGSAEIFSFGGMCPYGNATEGTWTSNATYSNTMMSLTSQSEGASSAQGYQVQSTPSRGPPIAEAGFTITGLTTTSSSTANGEAKTQQQDFVLLGGHTQAAFINTSQVALFSLPQQSWTFLPVEQPAGGDDQQVEPRSGHTAVLSEDGDSVIVFGGWVGDVNTPAQPQLAVLQIGAGYGGEGDWTWTVPKQNGTGLAAGAGMFGHGATLLPGGVMMIVGGYQVPAPATPLVRRDLQQLPDQILLYNITSSTWLDSYSPPYGASQTAPEEPHGPLSTTSQKAGLGVGLALALILLIGLIVFYFWYFRYLKRKREERTRALLESSSDGSFNQPFLEKGDIDERGGEPSAMHDYWQDSENRPLSEDQCQMQLSGAATGLFTNIPSPTRGLRKNVASRNYQYQPAPRYDEKRISRGSGNIHVIPEHEDEDSIERIPTIGDDISLSEAQRQLKEVEMILSNSARTSRDPFRDPDPNPLGSHPVSPEDGIAIRRVPVHAGRIETSPTRLQGSVSVRPQSWSHSLATFDAHAREAGGRVSPSKTDERTSSTLSERSQHSTTSGGSITRTMSTRTGALLAAAAAAASGRLVNNPSPESHSPVDDRTSSLSTGGRKSPFAALSLARPRSSTIESVDGGAPNSASTDGESFKTARTNIATLRTEGEALLGGPPRRDPDDPYQRTLAAHPTTRARTTVLSNETYLPSFPNRKRQGIMGSLRRAIGATLTGDRSFSFTSSSNREPYTDERSSSSSPTKDRQSTSGAPRRAVSDGGALLRQKRGQKDWEGNTLFPPYRDDPDPGDWGEPRSSVDKHQAEEDWDVEGAVTKRDVQVMFTIPKTRLRVVNDDMDRASLRSASDSILSRSGSVRTVRKEGSVQYLRSTGEMERAVLGSTAEEEGEVGEGAGFGKGKEKMV